MRVLLGPSHELHAGIHGALTDHPAAGVEYVDGSYSIFFQHPRTDGFSPIHNHSACEWVRFDDEQGVDLIHSARFPVETDRPWVVDADCLLLPLQIGAFHSLGIQQGASRPGKAEVKLREAFMLARFADPACRCVMLRSQQARRHFLELVAANPHVSAAAGDALAAKTRVVYPTVPARPLGHEQASVPSIIYMGRTFEDKGGEIAAIVFQTLRNNLGPRFRAIMVGTCPETTARILAEIGIELLPTMGRGEYLDLLSEGEIFFSPTAYESYGMGLVEAAAAGLAIVTSGGPGMEHIGELFEAGRNALLVSNALSEDARIAEYVEQLTMLILDVEFRNGLSSAAHRLTSDGLLSIARHNARIGQIYEEAMAPVASTGLSRSGLPSPPMQVTSWTERTCYWARRRHIPEGGLRICL